MPIEDEAIALHNESIVIDLHCHPSLKVKLYDFDINDGEHSYKGKRWKNSPSEEFFSMQYDLPKMKEGGINAIWSSVYVVEKDFVNNSLLKIGSCALNLLGFKFSGAIENTFLGGPFLQALRITELIEEQIKDSDNHDIKAVNPKNFLDFAENVKTGKKCIIHTLEGAHVLGRGLPSKDKYLENLETFYLHGVCSITLGHFIKNDICSPTNGIAKKTKDLIGFHYDYRKFENEGLSDIGKLVVEKMLEIGMIVDLNHVTEKGRSEIFDMNNKRGNSRRPLVFTHTGIRPNVHGEKLTPTIEEIKKIRACNGVIGVIFMNYWLVGKDVKPDNGIDNIVKTIKDISVICDGSFDNIAIGTDMDGFTQPVDDLYCSDQMQKLTLAMLQSGIKPDDIKKVLGLNAMRVMSEGWGKI